MENGARSQDVQVFIDAHGNITDAAGLGSMAAFLNSMNMSKEEFAESVRHLEPHSLFPHVEYQCYAEFQCRNEDCQRKGHAWQSILAWGVYVDKKECDCLSGQRPTRLFHKIKSNLAERIEKVGCVHRFFHTKECTWTSTWTLTSAWVPNANAGPPQQGCKHCHKQERASVCELVWDQPGHGHHQPMDCPKCCSEGGWCRGSLHKPDVLERYQLMADMISKSMEWRASEVGVEAEITLVPWWGRSPCKAQNVIIQCWTHYTRLVDLVDYWCVVFSSVCTNRQNELFKLQFHSSI